MAFLNDDFLLSSATSKTLYHEFASKMPIYDYHCHIDAKDIYEDKRFENIAQIWLAGDHYKWRLMRSNGISEYYITGEASDREKFQKFAETLPRCIGNPMYHWCHLELKNYFGYEGVLNGETAEKVWNLALEVMWRSDFSARGLIRKSNVAMVGTTDDPCSDLKYHKLLAEENASGAQGFRESEKAGASMGAFETKVCPSFRPDPILNIHKPGFEQYMKTLSDVCGFPIRTVEEVKRAITERLEYFVKCGCLATDHGLDYVMFRPGEKAEIDKILNKALCGQTVTKEEAEMYQTELLLHCGKEYARLGLVMQLHFSCKRNPNTLKFQELGPDTGFDCMAVTDSCDALYRLMDALEQEKSLPKTILYSLNPADDEWIDTLLGAFQSDEIPGKIQHGSAWWFNDNKTGMQKQLTSLANLGILGNFVGMLTDSRSLLSYARHEYFRRILCEVIGGFVANGEYPGDIDTLGSLVEDICGRNAKRYFGL